MYAVSLAVHSAPSVGSSATAAFAIAGSTLALVGTGSIYDIGRTEKWRMVVQHSVPLVVDVESPGDSPISRPDLRTAAEHLANIRQILDPAIADLASALGVSRQAIYKWIGGDTTPESDKLERLRGLSHAADAFRDAGVSRASALLKMKAFEGRSLLDLAVGGQLLPMHVESLIAEARAMDTAYGRSGLARAKAMPSGDWQAELSIPGSPE